MMEVTRKRTRATLVSSTAKTAQLIPTTCPVRAATLDVFPTAAARENQRKARAKMKMGHRTTQHANHPSLQKKNQKVLILF